MASVENGAAWAPDLLHRVDDAANRNPAYFAEHPRDVFGEHVWVTPFWEDDIPSSLDDIRTDRAPARLGLAARRGHPPPVDFVTESLAGLPDDTVRRIARENALELLQISLG